MNIYDTVNTNKILESHDKEHPANLNECIKILKLKKG